MINRLVFLLTITVVLSSVLTGYFTPGFIPISEYLMINLIFLKLFIITDNILCSLNTRFNVIFFSSF